MKKYSSNRSNITCESSDEIQDNLDAHNLGCAETDKENINQERVERSVSVKRKRGINWSEKETSFFIQLCIDKRIINLMDDKKYKHIDIYKSLEPAMKEAKFDKNASQMKMKMKHLKEMYYKCKRNNSISGHDRMSFQYFEAMDELLGGRPSAKAIEDIGIESSSAESQEMESTQETDDAEQIEKNPQVTSPVSNKKRQRTGGRLSNVKKAEQFSETFIQKQADMFKEISNAQNEFLAKTMKVQVEEQNKWEAQLITETMKKEHDFQMMQTNMLMDGFLKGLQMIQQKQYEPSLQSTFHRFPETSTYSSHPLSSSFMHNPSSLSPVSALSCSSNSLMSPITKIIVPPASPSPSSFTSLPVAQKICFVPGTLKKLDYAKKRPPSQTSPSIEKQTE